MLLGIFLGPQKNSPWLESAPTLPMRSGIKPSNDATSLWSPGINVSQPVSWRNRNIETHDISRSSKKTPWELDNAIYINSLQWNNNMSLNDHSAIFSILRTTRLTYQPHQNFQGRGRKPTWSDRHLSLYCPRNCSAPQRVKHTEPKHCDNGYWHK